MFGFQCSMLDFRYLVFECSSEHQTSKNEHRTSINIKIICNINDSVESIAISLLRMVAGLDDVLVLYDVSDSRKVAKTQRRVSF
jgi:hypothetical protein